MTTLQNWLATNVSQNTHKNLKRNDMKIISVIVPVYFKGTKLGNICLR